MSACALCGHPRDTLRCGSASINSEYYCHTDSHSCYHAVSVHGATTVEEARRIDARRAISRDTRLDRRIRDEAATLIEQVIEDGRESTAAQTAARYLRDYVNVRAERYRLQNKINEALQVHDFEPDGDGGMCLHCNVTWPCSTVSALDDFGMIYYEPPTADGETDGDPDAWRLARGVLAGSATEPAEVVIRRIRGGA